MKKMILSFVLVCVFLVIIMGLSNGSEVETGTVDEENSENVLLFLKIFVGVCIRTLLWGLICRSIVRSKGYTTDNDYPADFGFAWGILGIIGIIVCAVKPSVGEFANKTVIVQQPTVTNTPEASKSVSDQIKEISKLKDEGFITEEEYEAKKKKILGI